MKNLKILLPLLLVCSFSYGQSGFGIKGGLSFNELTTDGGSFGTNLTESYNSKTGSVWGVWGRLGQNKVYFQPEAVMALSSGKLTITDPNNAGVSPKIVDVKYSNVDVPLLIGIKPVSFLRVMAGPVASINISESENLKEALSNYTEGDGDVLADLTYGYQVGVGVKVLGLELDLRREGGLSNFINSSWAADDKYNQRKQGWQLTLGLKLL